MCYSIDYSLQNIIKLQLLLRWSSYHLNFYQAHIANLQSCQMRQFSLVKTLLSFLIISVASCAITNLTFFLTPDETWLFFPHRYPLNTFTAQCQLIDNGQAIQHPQLETVASFQANNTCIGIDILSDPSQRRPVFFYAKLTATQCTVYEVKKDKISLYYKYKTDRRYSSVLMLNRLNTLIWNSRQIVRVQYSLLSSQVNTYPFQFQAQAPRSCRQNTAYSAICWNNEEFLQLNFSKQAMEASTTKFHAQEQFQIKTILPLSAENDIYFVCESIICNISKIADGTITTKVSYNFVLRTQGGSVYPQINSILLVSQQHATIYTYILFGEVQLKLDESISFPDEFECVNYDHSVLTKDLIIIECFNFQGQQEKLILVRDIETNKYVPCNPFINKITEACWLSGNQLNLITVCSSQIKMKHTNFYFLELSSQIAQHPLHSQLVNLTVQCTNFDGTQQKQVQLFKIGIKGCQLQKAYVDQLIPPYSQMSYNQLRPMQLKNYFKSSNIVSYNLNSNCPFIQPQDYQPIQYLSYFSLYNRQKCVQIVSGGGELFYRLIQVNTTVFYLEQCLLNKLGYGCQLNQIYEGIQSVRLGIYDYTLIKIFIQNGYLKANYENITKEIFDQEVEQLEILDNIIRIKTGSNYYTNTIENVISSCGEWIRESTAKRYFYHDSTVLELSGDGVLQEYVHGKVQKQYLLPFLSFNQSQSMSHSQNQGLIRLPYILKKAYYIFIISQEQITKIYYRNRAIHIYTLPYNPQNYNITDITFSDIYLTIQYQPGVFEIYDIQQQKVSAKIVTLVQTIMTDVILLSRDMLLIPIQSQTTLIKIQRNPILNVGNFPPEYSRFHQICKFKLKVNIENGTCPASLLQPSCINQAQDQVYQQFQLEIKYNIQEITLGAAVQTQFQPSECSNCTMDLNQLHYKGPIFAYELNDDYFSQFTLIPHLEISSCTEYQTNLLKDLVQIRFEGDSSSQEVMMMDMDYIYLFNRQIEVTSRYKLVDTHFCSSYVQFQDSYLILCNQYLLFMQLNQSLVSFRHNLTVTSSNRHQLQLQFQKINGADYLIYLLDNETTIHIYQFNCSEHTIKHVVNYVFRQAIKDMKVVDNWIIILKMDNLCVAQRGNSSQFSFFQEIGQANSQNCYQLASLIPIAYVGRHQFEEIVPYYSSQSTIKILLISKNVDSLHLDLTLLLDQTPAQFTINNIYAGYPGFEFKEFISINVTNDSYSNFIILCKDDSSKHKSYMLAYYPYNLQYNGDKIVGQIKTAYFLQNYFAPPYSFSFLAFTDSMLITHHGMRPSLQVSSLQQSLYKPQQVKECLFVLVHPKLQIKLNYDRPPPIKFVVLRANNLNSIDSHFIRLQFLQQSDSLQICLIGLGMTILLFSLLAIATNRCKSAQSDIQVHFIREQDEISQPPLSSQQSSLLHSKGSSQIASDEQDNKSGAAAQEIIMIRQQ